MDSSILLGAPRPAQNVGEPAPQGLRRLCGPPVRDLASGIDVYRLPEEGAAASGNSSSWTELVRGGPDTLDVHEYLARFGGSGRMSGPGGPPTP